MALIAEELPGHWSPQGVEAAVDKYVLGKGKGSRGSKAVDIGASVEEMQVGGWGYLSWCCHAAMVAPAWQG